jgi:diguanylate cyclase (GGDEF)-like protein
VEALAVTDALTDLANRRRFDEVLAKEWRRALRDRKPLSLLLIDVDSFKAYNDMYGHRSGDDCLKEIAYAVGAGATRPGDLACRIGGDEFALLLPSTGEEGARLIGHKVAETVRHRALAHEGSPTGHVTVSVGCGTLLPQSGQTSAFLHDLADEALYAAKGSGRNKVCSRVFSAAPGQASVVRASPEKAL